MPIHYRKRAEELIETLKNDAVPAGLYDVKKLQGMDDTYRIRIEAYAYFTMSSGTSSR